MQNRTCTICTPESPNHQRGTSRVVIDGRAVPLCPNHAAEVAVSMPNTFEDLRRMFAGASGLPGDRRSPISRRLYDDRRVFPPRPEGRRGSAGRRHDDVEGA